jgi:hypothetical protein
MIAKFHEKSVSSKRTKKNHQICLLRICHNIYPLFYEMLNFIDFFPSMNIIFFTAGSPCKKLFFAHVHLGKKLNMVCARETQECSTSPLSYCL